MLEKTFKSRKLFAIVTILLIAVIFFLTYTLDLADKANPTFKIAIHLIIPIISAVWGYYFRSNMLHDSEAIFSCRKNIARKIVSVFNHADANRSAKIRDVLMDLLDEMDAEDRNPIVRELTPNLEMILNEMNKLKFGGFHRNMLVLYLEQAWEDFGGWPKPKDKPIIPDPDPFPEPPP